MTRTTKDENMQLKNLIYLLPICLIISCATGDKAISKMSNTQCDFLNSKLLLIKPEMDEDSVSKLIGPVYRGSGTMRPVWLCPENNKASQIAIYYKNKLIYKVRWMQMGKFVWEKNF